MKFSIITPTYKRRDMLDRAVASLIQQTYKDWEMIIINDSPNDPSYNNFVVNDPRIRCYKNNGNRGVNFSRNFGLLHLGAESRWVIFLDDDDYLAPDTLKHFRDLILLHGEQKWFITNRAQKNGESLTQVSKGERVYSYAKDYLLLRNIQGDATHCIETKLLQQNHINFLTTVKQGEEWFFFFHVGLHTKLMYSDHNSTISGGYDTLSGLNFRRRSKVELFTTLTKIVTEAKKTGALFTPTFLMYILARYALILVR